MFFIEPKTLTPQNLEQFLASGVVFPGGEDQLIVGWPLFRSSSPIPGGLRFFASDFYLEEASPWGNCGHWAKVSVTEFARSLKLIGLEKKRTWAEPNREEWSQKFERIALEFKTARLRKAVPTLTTVSTGSVDLAERAMMLLKVLGSKTGGSIYGFWSQKGGVLGITPEILFAQKDNTLSTMALAATATNPEDLQTEKNQVEHSYVVEDLVTRLSAFGTVTKHPQEIISFGTLFHLRTRIECELKERKPLSHWLEILHPTPALGTSPMTSWKNLKEIDQNPRRGYLGAPIGIEDENSFARALVGIRNVQWDGRETWITAGCGVVAQSDEQSEWEEILLKMTNVKRIFFS